MKPRRSIRQRQIENQDERNRRLARAGKGAKPLHGKSAFRCDTCRRKIVIAWSDLVDKPAPKCRTCGGRLVLVAACVNKGILPKLDRRP